MKKFWKKIVSGLVLMSLTSCGGSATKSDKVSAAKTLNGVFVSEKKQGKSIRKIPVENAQFITFKEIKKERIDAEKLKQQEQKALETGDGNEKPVFQDWFFPNFGNLLNTEKPSSNNKQSLDKPDEDKPEILEEKESSESKIEVSADNNSTKNPTSGEEKPEKKHSLFHNLFPLNFGKLISNEKSTANTTKEKYPDLHDIPHAPAEFTNPELIKNQAKEDIDSMKQDVKEHQKVIDTIKDEPIKEKKKEPEKLSTLPTEIIKQSDDSNKLHVPHPVEHVQKPEPVKSKAEEFEKKMKQQNLSTESKKFLVKDVSQFYKKKPKPYLEPATQNRYKPVYQN